MSGNINLIGFEPFFATWKEGVVVEKTFVVLAACLSVELCLNILSDFHETLYRICL